MNGSSSFKIRVSLDNRDVYLPFGTNSSHKLQKYLSFNYNIIYLLVLGYLWLISEPSYTMETTKRGSLIQRQARRAKGHFKIFFYD